MGDLADFEIDRLTGLHDEPEPVKITIIDGSENHKLPFSFSLSGKTISVKYKGEFVNFRRKDGVQVNDNGCPEGNLKLH